MPQALLPMIPQESTPISATISVVRRDGEWSYFCGVMPIFCHAETDRRSFRMFTAQLCCQGVCTQAEIIRSFGVSKNSVMRSVAKYRREGIDGFYQRRKARGGTVMTAEVTAQAQELLNLGRSCQEAAQELGIQRDTLRKAIERGAVKKKAPRSR